MEDNCLDHTGKGGQSQPPVVARSYRKHSCRERLVPGHRQCWKTDMGFCVPDVNFIYGHSALRNPMSTLAGKLPVKRSYDFKTLLMMQSTQRTDNRGLRSWKHAPQTPLPLSPMAHARSGDQQ